MKNNKKDWISWSIIAFFAIIYVFLIFNDSLWGDEGYTMFMLKKNFIQIVQETAIDVHPPLYYFIAKIFTVILGCSVPVVQLVSIIPVILVMIFVKIKSKKLFKNNIITILFIALIGFCPQAFKINLEMRMYTWAMFFVTCSGIYAYELYLNENNKKTIILFILSSLAAAYTHYYAAVTEAFIYLFLLISLILKNKSNWKKCIIIVGTTIIGYLPWIPVFIKQFNGVKHDWWLESVTGDSVLNYIRFLFEGEFTNIFLILVSISIVGLITYWKNNKKDKEAILSIEMILSFVLTVALGVVVSKLIRPLFVDRYMYPAVGLLFLGISIAITKCSYRELLKDAFIAIICLNLAFSFNNAYISSYKTGTEEFKKFALENIKKDEKIYSDVSHLSWTVLPYYLPNNEIYSKINNESKGYIVTEKTLEEIQEITKNNQIEFVFKGNIDNRYIFNIFYVS